MMEQNGWTPDEQACNVLIDVLCKSGELKKLIHFLSGRESSSQR
jgi:pentatricopeptide repeat protein